MREIQTVAVTFTYTNPAAPTDRFTRRLTGLDPDASDEQLIALGKVLEGVTTDHVLTQIAIAQTERIEL
ncbi:hypothetical protein [Lacticaseibacillus absianus]|uniref:hypothetical protein n=1 Tax=Lacticaseibacillus absianus TaxID=2729623 RepID=UPI0015C84B47|nr:hypothetical protein [Lacticaseibacillus absianus]